MTKQDYSLDVDRLYSDEIFDLDTADEHETGINAGRMRLPNRYDIAKYYARNVSQPSGYDNIENPLYEVGTWEDKENTPEITSADFDWQVTYRFPSFRHPNRAPKGKYGGNNVTYRRLYLILCEHFNGGKFFIDEYFETIYPYTMKSVVDNLLQPLKEQIITYAEDIVIADNRITKKGKIDRRYKKGKQAVQMLIDLENYARRTEEQYGDMFAERIKEDIISAITSGSLPCQMFSNTARTRAERARVGLREAPRFSATSELIRSIEIYVKIRGNEWKTRQGILV